MEKHFLNLNDRCEISCIDRNKRTLTLNRTNVLVESAQGFESTIEPCLWQLRGMYEQIEKWSLHYNQKMSCYELKSLDNVPFIHNGVYSYHTAIRNKDVVYLGHTKVRFIKSFDNNAPKKESLPWSEWPDDCFIVLEGKTGTGKTTLAKNIHESLHDPLLPFVHVNLSAYSKNLIESELFGHERGAFTGAVKDKRGAIELAGEGTLFIDEIDSLDLDLQVKLLTFLDNRKYRKVGGERELQSKCRIIFASGSSLMNMTREKRLREDFYFRIMSGLKHRLPSLVENKNLISTYIKNFERQECVTLSDELKKFLGDCPWPGNYRQLKSYLHRKKVLNKSRCLYSLGPEDSEVQDVFSEDIILNETLTLKELRRKYCIKVYNNRHGSIQSACNDLGITRNTLKSILAS